MDGVDTIITEQAETEVVKIGFLVGRKEMWIPMFRTIEALANDSEGDMMTALVLILIAVTGLIPIKQVGEITIGIMHQETEAGVQV